MDVQVDWINLGILALTLLGGLWGVYKYLQSRFDKLRSEHAAALTTERTVREEALKTERHERDVQVGGVLARSEAAHAAIHSLEVSILKQLHDLELRVSKEYASFKAIGVIKNDIMDAIGEVRERVNNVGERVDQVLMNNKVA